ncbi:unnamed protein product [Diabrotica balteata]|uniref:Ig-like domain-containing protein n=1 Tax=Diabrotica balteata TaxID=107213 RepID=A0A9N9SSB7_DIABA|nr:unnamed protein product [Diabrotica balteata]
MAKSRPGHVVTQFQTARLFHLAIVTAGTMKTAINEYIFTGFYPTDRNVFTNVDFAPAETTNNPEVPTAQILGGPDLHVDKGSTINLTCSIRFSPEPPAYIFWYHHDNVISYDSSRGGVTVITEKGDVTTSFLLIQNADILDSGKYSCSPSNADVASIRVFVLNGEMPAAMQTGSDGLSNSSFNIFALIIVSYLYTSYYFSNLDLNQATWR